MERILILSTNFKYILYEFKDGIGKITINRPDKFNALQYPLLMEIVEVFKSIMKKKLLRAVILEGAG